MNEDLIRWLAGAVVKAGGEVNLSREDLNSPLDLNIAAVEDDEGNDIGLRITATLED